MKRFALFLVCLVYTMLSLLIAQSDRNIAGEKFSQLKEELPTPNTYRVASGAPGHECLDSALEFLYTAVYQCDVIGHAVRGEPDPGGHIVQGAEHDMTFQQ